MPSGSSCRKITCSSEGRRSFQFSAVTMPLSQVSCCCMQLLPVSCKALGTRIKHQRRFGFDLPRNSSKLLLDAPLDTLDHSFQGWRNQVCAKGKEMATARRRRMLGPTTSKQEHFREGKGHPDGSTNLLHRLGIVLLTAYRTSDNCSCQHLAQERQ